MARTGYSRPDRSHVIDPGVPTALATTSDRDRDLSRLWSRLASDREQANADIAAFVDTAAGDVAYAIEWRVDQAARGQFTLKFVETVEAIGSSDDTLTAAEVVAQAFDAARVSPKDALAQFTGSRSTSGYSNELALSVLHAKASLYDRYSYFLTDDQEAGLHRPSNHP